MYQTRNSMNNLSSYCGLVDARISASKKYLPVRGDFLSLFLAFLLIFNDLFTFILLNEFSALSRKN